MPVKQKLTNQQTSAVGIDRMDNGEIKHEVDKKHKKHKKERK